jgi:polysaccharide pyruvyl transferase CsaB
MQVLVSGWIGSTNLGDELVFAGVRRLLGDVRICAISTDPVETTADHGVAAIDHRRVDLIVRAARQADLVVVGGGGLVQDETSPFNLPYHLSRAGFARLGRTPWIGLGLGVGPLTTPLGRHLARTLRSATAVTVRDEPSLELLRSLGVPARLAADAAFHLEVPPSLSSRDAGAVEGDAGAGPQVEVERSPEAIVVSLRPWSGGGGWLPVGWRRGSSEPDWFVPTLASALEFASQDSGLPVRFVAMQTDRDRALHRRVAAAMATPAELVVPDRRSVLGELATSRLVVAMRYHAGIGATLAGRPSVLVGYSPKVDALAATLGEGAAHLPFERDALVELPAAIAHQLGSATAGAAVHAGAEQLRRRAQVNAELVDQLLD